MASVARTLQAVRPHVPMIKFPSRAADANIGAAGNVVQSFTDSSKPSSLSSTKPSSLAGTGMETVPLKYQRRLITPEEMAYIERGGPE